MSKEPQASSKLPPKIKLTPQIALREPSELWLPPAQLSEATIILNLLFTQENINKRFESRCSSLDYFNNQAFGRASVLDSISDQIDNPEFPRLRRLHLNDLAGILAREECFDFRFVVLNIDNTLQIKFSMGAGRIMTKGTALSHSLLACGREEYSECVAAGMIYFQKEGDKWFINKLSNDSGHFKGSIETLITPLILLLEQDTVSFAPEVVLKLRGRAGCPNEVKVNLEDLKAYYQRFVLKQYTQTIIQDQTQFESIAEKSIVIDDVTIDDVTIDVIPLDDIPLQPPALEQNNTPLLAPVREQNVTPIPVITQSIFRGPIECNLVNEDEALDIDVQNNEPVGVSGFDMG